MFHATWNCSNMINLNKTNEHSTNLQYSTIVWLSSNIDMNSCQTQSDVDTISAAWNCQNMKILTRLTSIQKISPIFTDRLIVIWHDIESLQKFERHEHKTII